MGSFLVLSENPPLTLGFNDNILLTFLTYFNKTNFTKNNYTIKLSNYKYSKILYQYL